MNIHQSAEDYLEKILMLREHKGSVRSVDIARELGVTKPSVSYAVKNLREGGYLTVGSGGLIELTPAGEEIAARIYERHELLSDLLISFGVDEQTACDDACRMEHHISQKSIDALKAHQDRFRG